MIDHEMSRDAQHNAYAGPMRRCPLKGEEAVYALLETYASRNLTDSLERTAAPQGRETDPALHCDALLRPRLTTRAGLEIGAGVRINPASPDEDAKFLR
jgi:hypothetical protein